MLNDDSKSTTDAAEQALIGMMGVKKPILDKVQLKDAQDRWNTPWHLPARDPENLRRRASFLWIGLAAGLLPALILLLPTSWIVLTGSIAAATYSALVLAGPKICRKIDRWHDKRMEHKAGILITGGAEHIYFFGCGFGVFIGIDLKIVEIFFLAI